ncbi:MAG: Ankyrin-3 [Francisellaceae bacterium]|nr:Ankyrin-3 [Francisellaceae bacterium]
MTIESQFKAEDLIFPSSLSPLIWAAAQGDLQTVEHLLHNQVVDINDKAANGWTAVVFAAAMGHLKVVKSLVCKGASLKSCDKQSASALRVALQDIWPQRRVIGV